MMFPFSCWRFSALPGWDATGRPWSPRDGLKVPHFSLLPGREIAAGAPFFRMAGSQGTPGVGSTLCRAAVP